MLLILKQIPTDCHLLIIQVPYMWPGMFGTRYCSQSSKMNTMVDILRNEEDEDGNIQYCLGGLYKLYPKQNLFFNSWPTFDILALFTSNEILIFPHIIRSNLWIKQCSCKIIGLTYLEKSLKCCCWWIFYSFGNIICCEVDTLSIL